MNMTRPETQYTLDQLFRSKGANSQGEFVPLCVQGQGEGSNATPRIMLLPGGTGAATGLPVTTLGSRVVIVVQDTSPNVGMKK